MLIDLEKAVNILKEKDDFLVISHANPDGDTLSSAYALCGALQRIGKRAKPFCSDEIPSKFDFMKEAFAVQDFEPKTLVAVDAADEALLGDFKEKYQNEILLCIDHHISNKDYAENTLLSTESAATAELMLDVIKALGAEVDKAIATCIYTGIATDTGCFKFSNTTPKTHIKAAEMMSYGVDFAVINYIMFDMKTKGRIKVEQEVVSKMQFFFENKCAVAVITKEMMDNAVDVDSDDYGGVSAIPRQIKGVEVGVTIKEKKEGIYKASMRSSKNIDVSALCQTFGGGGHKRAAGCTLKGTLEDVTRTVVDAIGNALKDANLID